MQVSYTYYEDEVRDGFFVPGMMKRAWAAQIEVLEDVAKVCGKYNIPYFADAGTLLGAVRHKGFIPWDDDLDICMLREDYNRFLKVAKEELPESYGLLNIHTEPEYGEMICRVVNNRKGISFEEEHLKKFHEFPFVAGIDIFPLDCIAPEVKQEKARCEMVKIVNNAIEAVSSDNRLEEDRIRYIEGQFDIKIDRTGNLKNQLYLLVERLFSMYNGLPETSEIALMPIWIRHGSNKFNREWYQNSLTLPFESTKIQVPAMYDAILREKYGDYMKLVKGGGCHDYPFYKQQEEALFKATGIRLEQEYAFTMADLQRERPAEKNTIKVQAQNMIYLLRQAHDELAKAVDNGDIVMAMGILEECQNSAIAMGTAIERSEGEGCLAVGALEGYCENIYHIYEELSKRKETGRDRAFMNAFMKVFMELQETLAAVEDSVKKNIKVHKEVVFLPYKASMWDGFEEAWRAAKADPDCDVHVIPIPYYYKNWDGSVRKMLYEGSLFPQEVSVEGYEDYDFEKRRPDIIVIQNPYDEYDHEISVHPFFYSGNLLRFTGKLIYIPDFALDYYSMEGPRAAESVKHFITMPGVVRADKVVVQSEKARQVYIDALSRSAGEDTGKIWEEKIVRSGLPGLRKKEESPEIPEEWRNIIQRPDGGQKKVVLYCTSVSTLLQYGERMMEKLWNVFGVFEKYRQEVTLLWRPHPLSKEALESMLPQLLPEYESLIRHVRTSGWGIYDDSTEAKRAVTVCDAYYGDCERELLLCRQEEKPAMIQNADIVD